MSETYHSIIQWARNHGTQYLSVGTILNDARLDTTYEPNIDSRGRDYACGQLSHEEKT